MADSKNTLSLICRHCGNEFTARYPCEKRSFCSRACSFAYEKIHGRDWLPGWKERRDAENAPKLKRSAICTSCGRSFEARNAASTVCSRECELERERKRGRDSWKTKTSCLPSTISKTCKQCGESFEALRKRGDGARRICTSCALLNKKQSNKGSHRSRAKKHNVPYFATTRKTVIETYGRRCWICKRPIGKQSYPHPLSFSMDHVVPMALGGWHHISNLRPAHFMCNSLKADKYSGQLMLKRTG